MMQAFIAPLVELAEYQEILQKRKRRTGISANSRLCQFTKNTFDVCTWRWLFL